MMRGGDWRSAPLLPSATRGAGSMRSRRGPPLPVIAVVMLALMTLTFFVFQVRAPARARLRLAPAWHIPRVLTRAPARTAWPCPRDR